MKYTNKEIELYEELAKIQSKMDKLHKEITYKQSIYDLTITDVSKLFLFIKTFQQGVSKIKIPKKFMIIKSLEEKGGK